MATTYLDTFTSASKVGLTTRPADSGFTWTVQLPAWNIENGSLSASGSAYPAATFALDSPFFTATITYTAFTAGSRVLFGFRDTYNYLYIRHDGAGNVTFGRRVPNNAGSRVDVVMDSWIIPDQGSFAGTVVITRSADQIVVDINGTSHTITTNWTTNIAGRFGFDVETTAAGLLVDSVQVDTVNPVPSQTTYLDTFTEEGSSTVYLVNHKSDTGFAWTVPSSFAWAIAPAVDWVYGSAGYPNTPALMTLDSTAFTATIAVSQFAVKTRLIFRAYDQYNYLYLAHDGAGNMTLGRRTGNASAVVDTAMDTWAITNTGAFTATIVIVANGDQFTITIDGAQQHDTDVPLNRTGLKFGMDQDASGSGALRLQSVQVVTVVAPPLPPRVTFNGSAFNGGAPITGYTLHMLTDVDVQTGQLGEILTAEQGDTREPQLSIDLTSEMLAVGGLVWITAENDLGSSQASTPVYKNPPPSFHGISDASYTSATDPWSPGVPLIAPFTATNALTITRLKIKGDNTGCTAEIRGPMNTSTGQPGALLGSVSGDTEILELGTPVQIAAGQKFVVKIQRPAAVLLFWMAGMTQDPKLTVEQIWYFDPGSGLFMQSGANSYTVAMQVEF